MLFVILAFNAVPLVFQKATVSAASSRGCPGSWTINSPVTVGPNDSCTVAQNIVVQNGGNLTIKKSTIKMQVASDGQYAIFVQSGGQLHIIQNTTMTTLDGVRRTNLKAQAGSTLELRDSDFSNMGYIMPTGIGIEIYTSGAVVNHNNITNGFEGIYVQDNSATITNNTVTNMDYHAVEAYNSPSSVIADNDIKNNGGGNGIMITTGGAGMKILNNNLYNNNEGMALVVNTKALVKGNTVDQNKVSGSRAIRVDQSSPTIDGNHLLNANVGIQYQGQDSGTAKNNIIEYGDGSSNDVGIKVQQQSNPTIQGNTIYKWYQGMTVYGFSDPIVEKNTITTSTHSGIYYQNGKGTYRNNTINDSVGDGINMISGTDAKFYDNWIHHNGNDGMQIEASNILVVKNNISKNPIAGIHLTKTSTADIRDNLFWSNGYGVDLGDTAVASLKNNDFLDNVGGGILVGATNHVDWTVDKPLLARGNDFDISGNVTVKSTGSLELRGLTMKLHSTASKKYWLDAKGPLFLNASFVQASDQAQHISFRAYAGLTVVDGGIMYAGYIYGGLGEDAGVFVGGGTASFLRSYISHGYTGLVASTASVNVEKGSIDNNAMDGIKAVGGANVIVSNATLQGNSNKDLVLDGSSTIDMRNSLFNKNAVTFSDAISKLYISWFVGVHVAWPNDQGGAGDPVNGATVKVVDAQTTTIATRTTDANGDIGADLVLRELVKTQTSQTSYSPYNVSASVSPIVVGYNVTPIDMSKDVLVKLGDLSPPTITITAPKDNDVFNHLNVGINGTAADSESGIKTVKYSIDGGASWKPAIGTTAWNATMFLAEGSYTIIAKAWNMAGGYSTAQVTGIFVDKTPPSITWTSPANNTLINKRNVTVSGTTEPLAHLKINTLTLNASAGGLFSVDLPVVEGPNTITITAEDRAHNSRSSSRYITVDTIAPFINIDGPKTRTVSTVQMDITGTTEVGAKVFVNGGAVNVNPSTGVFSYSVTLNDGLNVYKFDAQDKAGNKNSTSVSITLKMKAPSLTVVAPKDGTMLKDKTVKAQAMTDLNPDELIKGYINGKQVTVDAGGAFSADVTLVDGANVITFKVMDDAGNNQSKTTRVTVDTTVPDIKDITPTTGTEVPNTQTTVWIQGKTEGGAKVTVNNKTTTAGTQGDFTIEVPLAVGPNTITITVTDKAGNTKTQTMTITRKTTGGPCTGSNCPCTGSNCNGNNTGNGDISKYLPIILIIIIVVVIVGVVAAMAGRKAPPPAGARRRPGDQYTRDRPDPYAKEGRDYPRSPSSEQYSDERGGTDQGYDEGPSQGAYDQNYDQGFDQGHGQEGYDKGSEQGYDHGQGDYDQGSEQGYDEGHGKEYYDKGRRY
jgi:parallel beta-helix repeat protein